MVNANLSRGDFNIDLPLIQENRGQTASVDIGKPNLSIHQTGDLNPRFTDQRSGIREHTLLGRFTDSTLVDPENGDYRKQAYADAAELANLIKSGLNGSPISLNIPMPEYDTDLSVVPQAGQESALTLEYEPGAPANVGVQVGLSEVSGVFGSVNQPAETPTQTDEFPGNIQIIGNANAVNFTQDVTITRKVGRPNSDIGTDTNKLPYYTDRRKVAFDEFEIRFQSSDPGGEVTEIANIFSNQLATTPITLNFNGTYGLGSFNVVPNGSSALRHIRETGIEGQVVLPSINLRVVK